MHLTLFLIVINACSVKDISVIDLEVRTTHVLQWIVCPYLFNLCYTLYIYTIYIYFAIYVILDRIITDDLMITDNRESEQYVQTTSFLEALELVTGFKGWFSHSLVALKSLHFLMSGVICIRFLNIFSAC